MDLREKENSESFRSQVMAQESFHKARRFFRTCRHAQKEYSTHSLGVLPLLSYLLFRPVCPVSSSSGAELLSPVWEAGSFVPSARGRSTMRSPAPDALSQPLPAAVIGCRDPSSPLLPLCFQRLCPGCAGLWNRLCMCLREQTVPLFFCPLLLRPTRAPSFIMSSRRYWKRTSEPSCITWATCLS